MIPDQPRTIKRGGGRQWLHPTRVKGRYQTLRTISTIALLAFMFAAPWLTIGGLPFIRLSFLAESFYLLGQPILIYEFYHFVQLALLLVVTLFLASAYFGRIWCGYACPQTIFIEQIFERIQTLIEGPAAHRIATQNAPMTTARLLRKIVKQAAFLAVSAAFGFNLVAIFVGPENIFASTAAVTVALLLTALAWFDSAYWREQFCHIACPYARFQSVMQDLNTRTIGYDAKRGEPRRKGKQRDGAGDCIDCGLCTRVCPSGIDIRQGASQLECTGCARCVDACDNVMATIKKPSGLIRYDKLHVFESPSQKSSEVPPSKRPRRLRHWGLAIRQSAAVPRSADPTAHGLALFLVR
jgi:cytochrome c oxidase accessory protein FixG